MEIGAIIAIVSGIAGIMGLFYLTIIGQKSIPELYKEWRDKRNKVDTQDTEDHIAIPAHSFETLDQLPSYEEFVRVLRKFWGFPRAVSIDVVCSEIPEDERPYFADPKDRNYLRYAKFADLDSLIYIRSSIAQIFPEMHIRDFSPSEYFVPETNGLVVIGGPPWNSKFREFQSQLPFRFIPKPLGEDGPLEIEEIECLFKPTWGKDGELKKDISIFIRTRVDQNIPVMLIAGCLTFGVLGASKSFLDRRIGPSNAEFLESVVQGNEFISVFETQRLGGFVTTPDFSIQTPLLILRRDSLSEGFKLAHENFNEYKDISHVIK